MKFLRICSLIYLVLSLILPVQLLAEEELYLNTAKYKAEQAANKDVNKACWFGAGFTIIGVGVAMMWQSSSPDPTEFVGKTPEYIIMYKEAYESKAKRIQTMFSSIGCGISLAVGCLYTIIIINEVSDAYDDCLGCLESNEEEPGACMESP